MTYRVDLSRPALVDAENIYLWIMNQSVDKANEWFNGLFLSTNSLSEFPNRCPIAPENRSFIVEVRQLLYSKGKGQCRIIFGVSVDENTDENVVLIYRIRRASQKYLTDLEIIGENIDE